MQVEKLYSQLKGLNGFFFYKRKQNIKKNTELKTKTKEQTNKPKDDFLTTSNRNLTEIIFSKRPKLNLVTVVKLKFKPTL